MDLEFFSPLGIVARAGVVVGTVIALFLVPCLYMALEDLRGLRTSDPPPASRPCAG